MLEYKGYIGEMLDDAMVAIEHDNRVLAGVLPKDYARPELDWVRLGRLIDMVGNVRVGDAEARSKDVLGRVYEYFLSQFAGAEGKRGGEFYTRGAWCGCWWRCWSPTAARCTTRAAGPRACSCSRWSSSGPTPPATATAAAGCRRRPGPTSRSRERIVAG